MERGALRMEQKGYASDNPYGKEVFRQFVLPIADQLREELAGWQERRQNRGGRLPAHWALIEDLDCDAIAFLAVRTGLNTLMSGQTGGGEAANVRSLAQNIGSSVYAELVMGDFEEINPELYFTLVRDFHRRMSKSERHRLNAMMHEAKKRGINVRKWAVGAREQVGAYLVQMLEAVGMIEILTAERAGAKLKISEVMIAPSVLLMLDKIKGYVALTSPVFGPCVEPPVDWTSPSEGGYHTNQMRRAAPLLVRGHPSTRHLYREAHMPAVLKAANALQRTSWRVNSRLLDVIMAVASSGKPTDEIVAPGSDPKPATPAWLTPGLKTEGMTAYQEQEFLGWKRLTSEWYTNRKLQGVKYSRFYAATRSAEMFRDQPALYFVYFADTRGRFYPYTYGINPQGSDLQRSLLEFSHGKPLLDKDSKLWFCVHGANKWGYDKASLLDRALWVEMQSERWLAIAADPLGNRDWADADKPLQFLAWCFEYAEWQRLGDEFKSHLPISMDGSCNGLQNLSAMLRDEVGGAATNLTASDKMQDIYQLVADRTAELMTADTPTDPIKASLRSKWLAHGVRRLVVKRTVMTTPYGVTRQSGCKYIVSDYIATRSDHGFDRPEWRASSLYLMQFLWPAIGDIVIKGRLLMDWLRRGGRRQAKEFAKLEQDPVIWWVTPSGFPAAQAYFEHKVHRIRTRLHGEHQIRVVAETERPDMNKHASGLAPNFVHSLDAAHLHLTAGAAADAGIRSLAMIHDDYGTHAADAAVLFKLIREQFVTMYEAHDPVRALQAKYPLLGVPPEKGNLDLSQVLNSQYFFS